MQLLNSVGQFFGLSYEDPKWHIQSILEISDTYIPEGVNSNYVRLTLFPFSLIGETKRWLHAEPLLSITLWEYLDRKFLIQFFPSGNTICLRTEILSFRQKEGENFYKAWERFKGMLKNCPHHH